MSCVYFTKRTRKYKPYFFCRLSKKIITFDDCKNCLEAKYKEIKPIKNKTNKLAKLEKNRFSILTNNMQKCYLCSKRKEHIHEIYKGSNRQISMKNGFCIPICEEHHRQTETNSKLDKDLKVKCQRKYEETHSREEFIDLIGQSYL